MKKLMITLPFIFSSFSGYGQNSDKFTGSLLWKVTGNGLESPSYIFGTFHFGEVSFARNYPGFNQALESCSQVAGEVDIARMNDPAATQAIALKYMTMPADTTYADLLSEKDLHRLDEGLKSYLGAGLDRWGQVKPAWLAMIAIPQKMYMECVPDFNLSGHVSMDQYVQDHALSFGKKIVPLETMEDQFAAILHAEPLARQAETLLCTVNEMMQAKMNNEVFGAEQVRKLTESYSNGDLYGLYALGFDDPDSSCPMSEASAGSINRNRNNNWMEKLPGMFADGPTFVAVGALHLCGEEGLLCQLDGLGYQIDAVK